MKHRVYTLIQNTDGTFCFENETNIIQADTVKLLPNLQPGATWILICNIDTYKRMEKERQGTNSEFE